MKSTLAAAFCKNIEVVIDEFVFVGFHSTKLSTPPEVGLRL
jgi:hypothetical protein